MIAEIKFKNLLSFRDETIFSFEADNSKDMDSYHVVEIVPGVRLLKLAVIYGANASGKSNFIAVCDFIIDFLTRVPHTKKDETGIVPFLLDDESNHETSDFNISFYVVRENQQPVKFIYSLSLTQSHIEKESLAYYPSQQPAMIFERSMKHGVSDIKFGTKVKLSPAAREEISLKCLPNMSVFAAYMQVNVSVPEIEDVLAFFRTRMMPAVTPFTLFDSYAKRYMKNSDSGEYVLRYLQEADFNINNIITREDDASRGAGGDFIFQHKVRNRQGVNAFYEFPGAYESRGTIRTMGIAWCVREVIENNGFLSIDEIESSLHPKLIEYIIERFLKESNYAQMLLTTHYDGLLAEEDLLRKDNVWFTEKHDDGATTLYPLTDFKGLNRISSLQKAYKFGKFGAVPNI